MNEHMDTSNSDEWSTADQENNGEIYPECRHVQVKWKTDRPSPVLDVQWKQNASTFIMIKFFAKNLAIHIVFLLSIFDVYFHSPVITKLTPLPDLKGAPSKRLVLFVADGLRSESFYANDGARTPFLRNVVLTLGSSGVSHTRVPTESRPGHVAMISGLYEDPSAVTKGWQENPIDFDSVFNRSRVTFSWGSPDILPLFVKGGNKNHIFTDSYTNEEVDFSGRTNTSWVDEWVFNRFNKFLANESNVEMLRTGDKSVIFLHLLGLDTAGHIHKPNSKHFNENLMFVDGRIREVYEKMERLFPDKGTSYVFTADHGMSDRGSHGCGHELETETPILVWGAGAKKRLPGNLREGMKLNVSQADIAPLMATLIGVSPPVNNYGRVPKEFLDVSKEYLANAMMKNSHQIHNQFDRVREIFYDGKLSKFLKTFGKEQEIDKLMKDMSMFKRDFNLMIKNSELLMDVSLEGIEYYQNYYRGFLLKCVAGSMLLWTIITLTDLNQTAQISLMDLDPLLLIILIFVFSTLAIMFLLLQHLSFLWAIYVILPIALLYKSHAVIQFVRQHWKRANIIYSCCAVLGIELLVLSFFYRFVLSILIIGMIVFKVIIHRMQINKRWLVSSLALAVFPSLPVIEKDANNPVLLCTGTACWLLWTMFSRNTKTFTRKLSLLLLIVNTNLVVSIITISNEKGVLLINQMISWLCFVCCLGLPLMASLEMNERLWSIATAFGVLVSITSLSYEPIFYFVFAFNVIEWLNMEFVDGELIEKNIFFHQFKKTKLMKYLPKDPKNNFVRMFQFMIFILVGFFGTGNIAAISSFDPNWVRCLVTSFKPILMATVIIIKLLTPTLFLICSLHAVQLIQNIPVKFYFKLIFVICDVMGINFLFLVRTTGSWLEIGQSITHFVLIELIVLVLVGFHYLVLPLTSWQVTVSMSQMMVKLRRKDTKMHEQKRRV